MLNFTLFTDASRKFSGESSSDEVADFIGQAILTGMLLEVSSHPKPGLVTPVSQGSHTDMNLLTFMLSSAAVASSFRLFAKLGLSCCGNPAELLSDIRKSGLSYEKKMLETTGSINTQRGILFAGGIISAAAGLSYRNINGHESEDIFRMSAAITQGICSRELNVKQLAQKGNLTAGEKLFLQFGVTGIRGEVENGFPSIRRTGLPAFSTAAEKDCSLNDCLVHALISLMTCVEDTTVLWRGGTESLQFVKLEASHVISEGSVFTPEGRRHISELNCMCIEKNISPGGSADMLALTAAVYMLENGIFPVKKM